MLQSLHEKTSGLFAKILLGIITVVFGGFFGTQQFMSSHSANYVAAVDGHEISQSDFRERWDSYRTRITRQFGNQVDMSLIETPERKRQLLDQMIEEQLVLDAADKQGAIVPRTAVQQEILSVPAFQADGKFDVTRTFVATSCCSKPINSCCRARSSARRTSTTTSACAIRRAISST
jgi:peptidyl-prolyl cis-trans isomerase D